MPTTLTIAYWELGKLKHAIGNIMNSCCNIGPTGTTYVVAKDATHRPRPNKNDFYGANRARNLAYNLFRRILQQ